MDVWVFVVIGVGVVVLGVGILALSSRSLFRRTAPAGASAGFRLFPVNAMLSGLAATWEIDRAAIAGVLREDTQVIRSRLAGPGAETAAAELRAAERAVDLFAANENWADNLRARHPCDGPRQPRPVRR